MMMKLPATYRFRAPRAGLYTGLLIVAVAAACSTDSRNPVGERLLEEGRLGTSSDSAEVFRFRVPAGDTTFAVPTSLGSRPGLIFGKAQNTTFHAALRFDLGDFRIGPDTLVDLAELRLDLSDFPNPDLAIDFTLHELADSLQEDTVLTELPAHGPAIPAFSTGDTMHVMEYEGTGTRRVFEVDTSLVRSWLRGTSPHPGILMRVRGSPSGVYGIAARSFSETSQIRRPVLRVGLDVGPFSIDTTFAVEMDITVPVNRDTLGDLALTDGFVQRVFFPVPIDSIEERVHIHAASLELTADTSRTFGDALRVLVYAPDSDDISSDAARTGVGVVERVLDLERLRSGEDSPRIELSIRNILQLFRDGDIPNHGLALRIRPEGGSPNAVAFYSSASDSLGPRYRILFSRRSSHEP